MNVKSFSITSIIIFLIIGCNINSQENNTVDSLCPDGSDGKSILSPGKFVIYDEYGSIISSDTSSSYKSFKLYDQDLLFNIKADELSDMLFLSASRDSIEIDTLKNNESIVYIVKSDSIGEIRLTKWSFDSFSVNELLYVEQGLSMTDSIFNSEYTVKTYASDTSRNYLMKINIYNENKWKTIMYNSDGSYNMVTEFDKYKQVFITEVCE